MRQLFALTVVVAMVALVFAPLAWAEDVQGKIKGVDQSGRMLVLEDGTQLAIPDNVRVNKKDLQPGAEVKASFEMKGTQKVITAIEVTPAGSK
jgi:hypothetical protein